MTVKPNTKYKKESFLEHLENRLMLPNSTLGGGARVELHGNSEAVIDGCRGVTEYDEETICLNLGEGRIRFCGRSLTICALDRNFAQITGFIREIHFI